MGKNYSRIFEVRIMSNKSTTNPLWGARFSQGAGAITQNYTSSVDVDKRLYKEDMEAISDDWNEALRQSLARIDEGWMKDLISPSK